MEGSRVARLGPSRVGRSDSVVRGSPDRADGQFGRAPGSVDVESLRRVIAVGRSVLSELDEEALLDRVLESAREITGARYAALGVIDESRGELQRSLVRGSDKHPRFYGVPAGHPALSAFLDVPILVRGRPWGNLYLAEKDGGEFEEADREAVVMLADWAGIAIEHARLYESAQRRGVELERAARGLEAARAIAVAIGGPTDLDRVLQLIVERGRALVNARSLLILLREGDELVVVASAGEAGHVHGQRIPLEGSTSGDVLRRRRPERSADIRMRLRISPEHLGVKDANEGMIVPLIYRHGELGVLIAFDHGSNAGFGEDDEQALRAFAASAATAVATAQTIAADHLRETLAAAEAERRRWARELHDQTLQSLGGLRMLLSTARRKADLDSWKHAGDEAIAEVEREIANLRGIINDLRPAALDDLGLAAALRALVEHRADETLRVECELSPPEPALGAELETTVYRLVQEALTNIAKHAHAQTARVTIDVAHGEVRVRIQDDGIGFDTSQPTGGYGVASMHERVGLAHGTLRTESGDAGTTVLATIPLALVSAAARAG
jgi:signal transduction histidine kinase